MPKLKCPDCQKMTLGKNGWYPSATHPDRVQKRRCRECGHTSNDGITRGRGRKPIGTEPMTPAQRVTKHRKADPMAGTARSGSYWYVIYTDSTKEGTIGLVRGNRGAIAAENPGKRVRLLSDYPAGMRRWIRETFQD